MFDEEGAVNELADASPADSDLALDDVYGNEEFLDVDEAGDVDGAAIPAHLAPHLADSRHWRDGSAPPPGTDASEVGSLDDNGTQKPENLGEGEEGATDDPRSPFIPRARFDEVHGKVTLLDQQLADEKERNAKLEARQTTITRAQALGYRDIAQFEHDDAWAKANNYPDIEAYAAEDTYKKQLRQEVIDGEISEKKRQDLLRDHQHRVRTDRELAEVRGLLQAVQKTTLDQTIASARSQFDHVDADQWAQIEKLCRDIGRPDAVQRVISTFAPAVTSAKKTAAERALIEHNSRRQANGGNGAPPPEGRGGGQAPPQLPKVSPQQAKSRLLSELLGFRR